jgi:hypothetical protein
VTPSRLPGSRWVAWLHNPTLRVGVLTGIYLNAVMVGALLAANRVPWLEPLALPRNIASFGLFFLVMLIPIFYFRRSAANLFACGMLGWFLFALGYAVTGDFFFPNLFNFWLTRSPFHVFVLGGVIYGVVAVSVWVATLLSAARHHPIAASRHHR